MILNIASIKGQLVPICATHWLIYSMDTTNAIREEVVKYLRDQDDTDHPLRVDEILAKNGIIRQTDETRGEYRTNGKGENGYA